MSNIILELKNLNVYFKRRRKSPIHIIRGVDIKLKKGQIIGIVGESGSGKSVSTKSLLNVNDGDITTIDSLEIDGTQYDDYSEFNWKDIRGIKVAYIPQDPMTSMNPSRKIYQHMFDVLKHYRKDEFKSKEEMMNHCIETLQKLRINATKKVLKLYPHELSGGMKQRIIIAMTIMSGAKIIVADEPTTALDATVQSSVLKMLVEINQEYDISIIFISHNIGVVAKLCDYIYVMYAGRIVEKASKEKLFMNPKHPYTWALISSIPEGKSKEEKLYTIQGTPPDMANLPPGDPFAPRNDFAVAIDFKKEPPLFEIEEEHWAATWTLHPSYPKIIVPKKVQSRLEEFKNSFESSKKKGKNNV